MKKKISGWGRYPMIEAEVKEIIPPLNERIPELGASSGIASGMRRSYGDSALASEVFSMLPMDRMLDFDKEKGVLRCEAGVTLADILRIFVNRGWFLPVTPGTKHITVGGAIASDIHGKNHHQAGCFSEYVLQLKLLGPEGKIYQCSPEDNPDLFHATCGGMGLTGIILEATIKLKPIHSSRFDVLTLKARNLRESFDLFESYADWPYSVAWIDCLASGKKLGRSLLMVGRNREDQNFAYSESRGLSIPFNFPGVLLNKMTVSMFNALYYNRIRKKKQEEIQDIDTFFYPLDMAQNWNRLYGRNGFLQYQFVLPKEESFNGLQLILGEISKSGKGSFLSVLKLMGTENKNFLSFPMEGYTLALDFKVEPGIFNLLNHLDRIVSEMGGRIYLTKDARMSREIFEYGYPRLDKFREVRKRYGMAGVFESEQSKRLGI